MDNYCVFYGCLHDRLRMNTCERGRVGALDHDERFQNLMNDVSSRGGSVHGIGVVSDDELERYSPCFIGLAESDE